MKQIVKIIMLSVVLSSCQSAQRGETAEVVDPVPIEVLTEGPSGDLDDEVAEDVPAAQPGELEQRLIDAGLVNVQDVLPEVFVDLRYSTEDNFFKKDVYGELENCYVQPVVAEMLGEALAFLHTTFPDLTFKIYDGVRPLSVQQILWDELDRPEHVKPLYVADPKKGGLHNYGVAVDLTLVNRQEGEELDMGTGYDFFGYPAYPDREEQMLQEGRITEQHIANRVILREAMLNAGFTGIGSEWWHFNAFSRKVAEQKFEMVK